MSQRKRQPKPRNLVARCQISVPVYLSMFYGYGLSPPKKHLMCVSFISALMNYCEALMLMVNVAVPPQRMFV
jgi:hypothetical protein